jgi:adenylate kinase
MNHRQKLEFQTAAERFLEKNKVDSLFENLLKELLIHQPENPIDFLISQLKAKDYRRLFFVGPAGIGKCDFSKVIA